MAVRFTVFSDIPSTFCEPSTFPAVPAIRLDRRRDRFKSGEALGRSIDVGFSQKHYGWRYSNLFARQFRRGGVCCRYECVGTMTVKPASKTDRRFTLEGELFSAN
jgi:hypothetical protein